MQRTKGHARLAFWSIYLSIFVAAALTGSLAIPLICCGLVVAYLIFWPYLRSLYRRASERRGFEVVMRSTAQAAGTSHAGPFDATDATNPPNAKIRHFVHFAAMVVGGTEAVAFVAEPDTHELTLLTHIGGGKTDASTRARAARAFADLTTPCLREQRDSVYEVNATTGNDGTTQFCLVRLLHPATTVTAVLAVIVRCHDIEQAEARLTMLTRLTT